MDLSDVLDARTIRDLAGPGVYPRGVSYHADDRVEIQSRSVKRVKAKVRGTVPYSVELWVDRDKPRWSCSCPYAQDGLFCKHAVAVALTLESEEAAAAIVPEPREPAPAAGLSAHVEGLSRERLAEIVLDQCQTDWALRERLDAEARAVRGSGLDLGRWQKRIDEAFSPYRGFVEYREVEGWASAIHDVLDNVEQLVDTGHASAVIALAEHAHRCTEAALEYVDDSDGWLADIDGRVSGIHLAACEVTRPEPASLARRLVDLELASELDGFHRAAASYVGVLGEHGIAEYRRILEPRWEEVRDSKEEFSSGRFRVEQAMIGVALASADPDALIEILSEGTLYPHDYVEIAGSLADVGREDESIDWARRGLGEWPSRPRQLSDLRELLADLLRGRGDAGEAVHLFWEGFGLAPSLSSYRDLLAQAGPDAGEWGSRCIDLLRTRVTEESRARTTALPRFISSSSQALVEILMYEGYIDGAWEVATESGVSRRTWSSLARAREATHPLDSIGVYQSDVEGLIGQKKRPAYESAVRLLARIEDLMDRAGQPEVFRALVQRLRTEHKPKWSLMEMFDRKGW